MPDAGLQANNIDRLLATVHEQIADLCNEKLEIAR
jgi:hypothetical protein